MRPDTDATCENVSPDHAHICIRHDGHFGSHICDCGDEWPRQ